MFSLGSRPYFTKGIYLQQHFQANYIVVELDDGYTLRSVLTLWLLESSLDWQPRQQNKHYSPPGLREYDSPVSRGLLSIYAAPEPHVDVCFLMLGGLYDV